MGALAPARLLSPADLSIGGTVAVALPTGELADAREEDAAVASLANAGFAATLSGRLGLVPRVEASLEAGPTHLALGARWAAIVPGAEEGEPDGWDLALGLRGVALVGGSDDPDDAFELEHVAGGGATAEVRAGRTWSDFVSVWASAGAGLLAAELQVAGGDAAQGAWLAWAGGTVGLRVGLRHVFTGLELGARWVEVRSGGTGAAGLVLVPAVGLAIETR